MDNGIGPLERHSHMEDPETPLDPIEEAALSWLVRLRDIAAGPADRRRHAEWLAADPRHRAAWDDAQALWHGLDGLRGELGTAPRRRTLYAAALAASVVLAAVGLWQAMPYGLVSGLTADARSGVGERRTVTLADGSTVELGTASALSVAFTESERRVKLHHGEGYFTVTRNSDKPFVVDAGDGKVTVVGTQFDVKLDHVRYASVAVTEGIVEISSGGRSLRLGVGEGARYSRDGMSGPEPVDLLNLTAWRSDRLVFRNQPLGEVVRELERYRWGRIVLTDAALAALPVTGVFNAGRTDAALDTISSILPIKLIRVTSLLTVLSAR